MKRYKENVDFSFVEVNGVPALKILTDDFKSVIYMYQDVSTTEASESDPDLPLVLSFHFDIIDSNNYTSEEFETLEFKNKIGDILVSILTDSSENVLESE